MYLDNETNDIYNEIIRTVSQIQSCQLAPFDTNTYFIKTNKKTRKKKFKKHLRSSGFIKKNQC